MYKHIVANKGQELDVLGKLEEEGFVWVNTHVRPTSLLISESDFSEFPYVIIADSRRMTIEWSTEEAEFNGDVFFDGREELHMKKYKVTKEFMDKLVAWRGTKTLDATNGDRYSYVGSSDLDELPRVAKAWWYEGTYSMERNHRLIAIISWLNGEDVFEEVEKPHKFVVRSDVPDDDGDYPYVVVKGGATTTRYFLANATKFDTREGAESWANSHQVVVEIDADGKEV